MKQELTLTDVAATITRIASWLSLLSGVVLGGLTMDSSVPMGLAYFVAGVISWAVLTLIAERR